MLRLVDPNKHHTVIILDSEFKMRSMTVREKIATIERLSTLKPTAASFDDLISQLSSVILTIDNKDAQTTLESVEAFGDILTIVNAVVEYCSLKDDEAKNSGSSSDTSTPTPTGN
jgi:hypothetical protein